MQIICVRQGNKYTDEDVNLLYRQFQFHEPKALFYCLSDRSDHEPETIPLKTPYKGWWAKMELFSPWMEKYRPFLYIDLDTLILGPIGDVWEQCQDNFWMLRDFYRPEGGQSAMMWIPKDVSHIWKEWEKDPQSIMDTHKGDQDFLETFPFNRFQDLFSGHMSYKADKLTDSPREAVTVHFHGKPKPKDCNGWVKDYIAQFA